LLFITSVSDDLTGFRVTPLNRKNPCVSGSEPFLAEPDAEFPSTKN
jgi:hypothetical protein